jgi:Cell morphogenesis C-terminal
MDRLCREILSLLIPLYPQLRQSWGELALAWGCDCAIRGIAFRSLQLFRALMPKINRLQLANMIGRISGTVSSATDESLQSFTREVLITYAGLVKSNLDPDLLPPLFWCACACLSTTVEQEFLTVLQLLEALLTKLDLDDAKTVDALISYRPTNWGGPEPTLQPLIMQGLRSFSTCDLSLTLLGRLAKIDDAELIDPSGGRVREMFTVLLPWCLNKMDGGTTDVDITTLAIDIAQLAELEGRHSISKLMKSFSKGIIRTRDDLLRQGVSCIREHSQDPTVPVTLLLGLVLNSRKWIQIKTMEILKTLFQNPLSRTPIARSELLDPLLRLLTTDLAPQALEVLDEPLTIAGGPNPAQGQALVSPSGQGAKTVFGIPTESGWAVPMPEERIQICRSNILAVYDTCKPNNRPSMITFEPETRNLLATQSFFPVQNPTSLGDLVSTLNDLNNFFQKDDVLLKPNGTTGLERADSKRRVAEIVSRSLGRSPMARTASSDWATSQIFRDSMADTIPDGGNTPFIGLFSVSNSAETASITPSTSIESMNNNFLCDPDGGENDSLEEHANMYGNGTFYHALDGETPQQQYSQQSYDEYTVRVPSASGFDAANGTNGRYHYDSESDSGTDSFALDRLVGRARSLVRRKSSAKARSKSRGPSSTAASPNEDATPASILQRYERRR